MIRDAKPRQGLTMTFNTTEDCNLRCKYCYEIDKKKKDLPLEYAYKFIDLILTSKDLQSMFTMEDQKNSIILDFIGGDSLMNVDEVDKIITYFVYKANMLDSIYARSWKASISSNGTLFNEKVKKFCEKWKDNLYVGVSIDGCPEIHDLNRVHIDGSGSMRDIMKDWEWYKSIFSPVQTKATCSKQSIPYLYDSLKYMYETMGIRYISQNFIMEDMHLEQSDLDLFDEQMKKCCDYVLEHRHEMYWRMIDKHEFAHAHCEKDETEFYEKGHCGSGGMPCLAIDGSIYPCFRWTDHTQPDCYKGRMKSGDVFTGLNIEKFKEVLNGSKKCNCTKEQKCIDCDYESACSYCIGGCYAEYGDFIRTTHICEITKRQVKWARYYWDRYNELEGLPKEDWTKKEVL